MSTSTEEDQNDIFKDQMIWFFSLCSFGVLFLIAPCCSNARRRRSCLRRILWWKYGNVDEEASQRPISSQSRSRQRISPERIEEGISGRTGIMPDQDSLNKSKFILALLTNFTLELGLTNFKTKQISDEPETSDCDIDKNCNCKEPKDCDDTSVEYSGNREQAQALMLIPLPGMPLCEEDPQLGGQKYENKNKKLDETQKNMDVPIPESDVDSCHRSAPILCAICLGDYVLSDRVCWSSNARCHHVYHRDCIVSWLTSKRSKSASKNDCLDCPSCRQDFVDLQNDHVAVAEKECLPNDEGHFDDMGDAGSAFVSL